jgi:hypothetical protein
LVSSTTARNYDPIFPNYDDDDPTDHLHHVQHPTAASMAAAAVAAGMASPWPPAAATMASDRHHQLIGQHFQQQLQMTKPQRCYPRQQQQRAHVKKPLNAFMIFMKEMRQSVMDECTLKESAAINQILGRRVSISITIEVSR